MATIHRHRIPADSYEPNRPLNDLGRDQLKHFIHVAERLPPGQRILLPVPSPEDGLAASRFIGAVTEHLLSLRRSPLEVVSKKPARGPRKAVAPATRGVLPALAASESAAPTAAPKTSTASGKTSGAAAKTGSASGKPSTKRPRK